MQPLPPALSAGNAAKPPEKRSSIACRRCHTQKIKCTGGTPCRGCVASHNAGSCQYPHRTRKVTVSERYLKKLKAEIEAGRTTQGDLVTDPDVNRLTASSYHPAPTDPDTVNPLFQTHTGDSFNEIPYEHAFMGEAACKTFANRVLQSVAHSQVSTPTGITSAVQNDGFNRMASEKYSLPDRIHAQLLIQVAYRYLGKDHHLFLKNSFMGELQMVYKEKAEPNPVWLCKLFGLLALGELYSNCNKGRDNAIPGSGYFSQATSLLQDLYETATVLQVEVLLLLAFYANTLGRVKSAYAYSGIAIRIALGLGMHRCLSLATLSPVERENRRRIWWSLYYFDRYTCSKLGQPISIRDDDIDIELPSMDGLSPNEREEFAEPEHLCATVQLAKITGNILSEIYCLPMRKHDPFVQRVHNIFNQLRNWESNLPDSLTFSRDSEPRHVSSLHLAYNLCLIQTTRPVLFHLFTSQFSLHSNQQNPSTRPPVVTVTLAESCVHAARTTNKILSKLYIDGTLVRFGYWDAHYLFSSTLILIMSSVMSPDADTSDAIQTAFDILRSMRDDGNISASEYFQQLNHIQQSVTHMQEEVEKTRIAGEQQTSLEGLEPGVSAETTSGLFHVLNGQPAGPMAEAQAVHADRAIEKDMYMFSNPSQYTDGGALANPPMDQFLADFSWPASPTSLDAVLIDGFFQDIGDAYQLRMPQQQ